MVQLRVMTDDKRLGEDVLAVLLPLLKACTALRTSEPTKLTHRGDGLRVTLDVQLADPPTVRVERADAPTGTPTRSGAPTARRPRARRALPPAG